MKLETIIIIAFMAVFLFVVYMIGSN